MSTRPDPNFIPRQETGPAGGWAHNKVSKSRYCFFCDEAHQQQLRRSDDGLAMNQNPLFAVTLRPREIRSNRLLVLLQ
jgi:hypothetical protein